MNIHIYAYRRTPIYKHVAQITTHFHSLGGVPADRLVGVRIASRKLHPTKE